MKINSSMMVLILISVLSISCAHRPFIASTPPTAPSFFTTEEHLNSVKKALEQASSISEKIDILIQGL